MGLCKCGRRKFTNLFCYEHRVNVCEFCIVSTHSTCVVQSYLAWLHDENYDPDCSLCGETLANPQSECVRLTCLHLYHWKCLDRWASTFPATTAPAGYKCPTCQEPVFPRPNHVSPIVDKLREQMKSSNWARAGLGLPLMEGVPAFSSPAVHQQAAFNDQPQHTVVHNEGPAATGGGAPLQTAVQISSAQNNSPGMVDQMEYQGASARKSMGSVPEGASGGELSAGVSMPGVDQDLGENKYKRRSASEWFTRWIKSRSSNPSSMSDPLKSYKRTFFLLLLLIIGVVTVITVLTSVSRSRTDIDPFLDPLGNPNVRVAADKGFEPNK